MVEINTRKDANMNKVSRLYRVHCPYYNKEISIRIGYTVVPMLGTTSNQYKKTGCSCEYSDLCNCLDRFGACECYYNAPSNPE